MYVLVKEVKTHGGKVYPKGTAVQLLSMDFETAEVATALDNRRFVTTLDSIEVLIDEESSKKYVVVLEADRVVGPFDSKEAAGQWAYDNYIEPYWAEDELKESMKYNGITSVDELWKVMDADVVVSAVEEPE